MQTDLKMYKIIETSSYWKPSDCRQSGFEKMKRNGEQTNLFLV